MLKRSNQCFGQFCLKNNNETIISDVPEKIMEVMDNANRRHAASAAVAIYHNECNGYYTIRADKLVIEKLLKMRLGSPSAQWLPLTATRKYYDGTKQ